jgi:tetratricopeptide (TPR) repeat protein
VADAAFYSLNVDQLTARIKARIERQRDSRIPAFTLLLGSGFSYPLIPTAGSMLGDIAWWLYGRGTKPPEPYTDRPPDDEGLKGFEASLWPEVREECERSFELLDGVPGGVDPTNTGKAYRAIMSGRASRGLSDPQLRRQYLRAVSARPGMKVNGAHLYLAGILRAQEHWAIGGPFCRTIFTTNFDPLLQRSLQLVNKLYYMTDRPEVLEPPEDEDTEAVHLVYSHGSMHRYLLLNTDQEIQTGRVNNAAALVPYFERHGVLVIGYSGWQDTTMEALRRCRSFDGNLYWCDIHAAAEAPRRLGPDVVELLRSKGDAAFYVPIQGANEAMQTLHRDLGLGETPSFIDDPIAQTMADLRSIDVSPVARDATAQSVDSLKDVLERKLRQLEAAREVFQDPTRLGSAGPGRTADTAKAAVVAKRMNDALAAAKAGRRAEAVRLWTSVVNDRRAPVEERAAAYLNRGVTYSEMDDPDREIADYTSVIQMTDAPIEHRTQALVNRGITYGEQGRRSLELRDYERVIDMGNAPPEQKAQALIYRGITKGERGDTGDELRAYQQVIEMPDAPAEQRARALLYRGYTLEELGQGERALQDYSEVVSMAQAPPEQKAEALQNRGALYAELGDVWRGIADYTSILALAEAPMDARIAALNNRAMLYRQQRSYDKAAQDYTNLLGLPATPREDKADALGDRGWIRNEIGDLDGMLADSRAALSLDPGLAWVRFNLGLGLLLSNQTRAGRAEYLRAAKDSRSAEEVQDAIDELARALRERRELAGAVQVLAGLKRRLAALGRPAPARRVGARTRRTPLAARARSSRAR